MIDEALIFINSVLNQHLVNRFDIDSDITSLNNLVSADGSEPITNQNKVILTLINLEHETATPFYGGRTSSTGGSTRSNPSLHFNLDLLITANFEVYSEALKFLTATIGFFQAHYSFNAKSYPDIPSGLNMLNFEVENSPYEKTHNLWSALSAKYRPSIIYKIRHVTVNEEEVKQETPIVVGVSGSAS